jgi:hypothetical protein
MEAICSSETSAASQQTTRHHIPEDDTLQRDYCWQNHLPAELVPRSIDALCYYNLTQHRY